MPKHDPKSRECCTPWTHATGTLTPGEACIQPQILKNCIEKLIGVGQKCQTEQPRAEKKRKGWKPVRKIKSTEIQIGPQQQRCCSQ